MATLAVNKGVLYYILETVEILLHLRLVGPVQIANIFEEAHGILGGGTSLSEFSELTQSLRIAVGLVEMLLELFDQFIEVLEEMLFVGGMLNGSPPAGRGPIGQVKREVPGLVLVRRKEATLKS